MASAFREVVIDCKDIQRVAGFWSAVLGWPIVHDPHGYCWMSSTGQPDAPPPLLTFSRVSELKTVKNRVHIDVNPTGCDQAEELARLLSLGATHVDIGQGDVPWFVLVDPEGNEFCLLAQRIN